MLSMCWTKKSLGCYTNTMQSLLFMLCLLKSRLFGVINSFSLQFNNIFSIIEYLNRTYITTPFTMMYSRYFSGPSIHITCTLTALCFCIPPRCNGTVRTTRWTSHRTSFSAYVFLLYKVNSISFVCVLAERVDVF